MAKEIERYRAKINFEHKFETVTQKLDSNIEISSPKFFARNIPFYLDLLKGDNGDICCDLNCNYWDGIENEDFSLDVEYKFSLISRSKTIQSGEIWANFNCNEGWNYERTSLSEIFAGEEIIVDDAITLELSLWADEPEGASGYKPPKNKLRLDLQIVENQVQSDKFASLLDSEDFSDVIFVTNVDSSRIKAHKAILAARSEVFARMLTTDMKEAKDNEIVIDDMGAHALKILLRHIYTGQLEFPKWVKIDLKICQELANAGEKYDLQNLKEYAAMAMTEFVSLENALELFLFAKRLKAEAAIKALTSYYGENVYKILEKM